MSSKDIELDSLDGSVSEAMLNKKEEDCLEELKEFIQKDSQVQNRLDDEELLMLVRTRVCSSEGAFKLLKTIKTYLGVTYAELFQKADPDLIKHVVQANVVKVVKQPSGRGREGSGSPVLIISADNWIPRTMSMEEIIMTGFMFAFEIAKSSVENQRDGIVMLIDLSAFGFSHAKQLSFGNVSKMVNCIVYGSPFRIRNCIIIHSPFVFGKVWQVVKFAIPAKMRAFVHVTGNDLSVLHKTVSVEYLIQSLGGNIPDAIGLDYEIAKKIMEEKNALKFLKKLT